MMDDAQTVILNHPEALALLTWLDELHLQVSAAASPSLHAALSKLRAARGDAAELVENSGRVYDLTPDEHSND